MRLRPVIIACTIALIVGACSGGGSDSPTETNAPGVPASGGTLRVAMTSDFQAALDPAKQYEAVSAELYRCCLLRTLLAFEGVPGDDGGSELRPDLATELPVVSDDGLTWTFTIEEGIVYAPPFEAETVTAEDFVRALEREADPRANVGGYSFYFSVIEGFDDFTEGKAKTISGISVPSPQTLEVRLSKPTGDLGYRFALPATAPIPPLRDARMGAAAGHTADYGRFLIGTGPYMIEGSGDLDPTLPADDQEAIAGYVPGRSLVLVRNPSWDASTDSLRAAYATGIEIVFGGETADLYDRVQRDDLDLVLDASPPADVVKRYVSDPSGERQLRVYESDSVSYLEFNVLEPPFDDVHVRRAVNLAIDKAGLRTLRGGEIQGRLTGHIMPNSLQGEQLADYDPYATPGSTGDADASRAEMAESAYGDANGRCVHESCDGVLTFTVGQRVYQSQAALISQNLAEIGITLDVRALNTTTMYAKCADPAEHMGLCIALSWEKDYPDATTFAVPLFSSESIFPSCCNDPLVGAPDSLLDEFGYDVASAPTVDDDIRACVAAVGQPRIDCWAQLDRTLMEDVVPWVPWLIGNGVWLTSERVASFSYAQSTGMPALDRIALSPSGG